MKLVKVDWEDTIGDVGWRNKEGVGRRTLPTILEDLYVDSQKNH